MKKTAIIILNYNDSTGTRNCLESILKHNTAEIKIIVVDNASCADEQNALADVLDEMFDKRYTKLESGSVPELPLNDITLIETGDNLGYACGNNAGLMIADKDPEVDNILILNSDIIFVEDIIPGLINLQQRLPDCAIVSPVLYKKDLQDYDYNCARTNETLGQIIATNFLTYLWAILKKSDHHVNPKRYLLKGLTKESGEIEIELPSGSCMLIRKDLFRQIGYFDPGTFLYYEENILYKKTASLGLKNYLSLDLKCIHLGATTIIKLRDNPEMTKKKLASRRYYVDHYSGANAFEKLAYRISERFFIGTRALAKMLK